MDARCPGEHIVMPYRFGNSMVAIPLVAIHVVAYEVRCCGMLEIPSDILIIRSVADGLGSLIAQLTQTFINLVGQLVQVAFGQTQPLQERTVIIFKRKVKSEKITFILAVRGAGCFLGAIHHTEMEPPCLGSRNIGGIEQHVIHDFIDAVRIIAITAGNLVAEQFAGVQVLPLGRERVAVNIAGLEIMAAIKAHLH